MSDCLRCDLWYADAAALSDARDVLAKQLAALTAKLTGARNALDIETELRVMAEHDAAQAHGVAQACEARAEKAEKERDEAGEELSIRCTTCLKPGCEGTHTCTCSDYPHAKDCGLHPLRWKRERDALAARLKEAVGLLRDRDALWCRALLVLDPRDVNAVTAAFNLARPDAVLEREGK